MRIVCSKSNARNRSRQAFTMLEIAISLAVIGFALLAIVGLLPQGVSTQKDNREDTIISQDGAYFIEAIRGGVMGLDNLTNFVDRIVITNHPMNKAPVTTVYSLANRNMTNGANIVRLLSTPKYQTDTTRPLAHAVITNTVIAYVRALSGWAILQGTNNPQMAFEYQLRSEVTPFNSWDPDSTNYTEAGLTGDEVLERSTRWTQIPYLTNNLYDVRLRLWPMLPNGAVITSKVQNFRTTISASQNNGFFDPQTYQFP